METWLVARIYAWRMAKLTCACGEVISTSGSSNESEGVLFSQSGAQDFLDALAELVDALTAAVRENTVNDWRSRNLGSTYPTDTSHGEMMRDIMYDKLLNDALDVLECRQCGRLWVQAPRTNDYRAYAPNWRRTQDSSVWINP